ncbi:MAG: sulfatase-like hydrolase/transferase, partial [Deltaproteobacteria bacterium]|nr:sulfatase-like hydrolase/transferase [Deltaproteobacteria bacterium]
FREAGYYTFHVGKWHVGNPQFNPDFSSISAGFNESAIKNRAYYYYSELAINHDFNDIEYLMDTHLTKGLTDKAIEKIEAHITGENNNLPFFLNLWYMAPHSKMGGPGLPPEEEPYQAPEDWLDFYNTPEYDGFSLSETAKAYAALVSYLDEQIGVLLHELDNRGLTDNTIVVFSSDNGPTHIVEYNKYWSNDTPEGDLRGRKGMFFEGGIRVPLIVKWPNKVPSSTENASVLMTADFYPTFAELAGIQSLLPGLVPEDQLRAGKSFVDTLINNSESPREETLFWEGLAGRDVSTNPVENENKFGIRKRNWKMVRETRGKEGYEIGRPEPYLFDLQDDPGESTDLASAYPEIVQGLLDEYSEWRKEIGTIRYHIDSILGDADILDGVMRFNEGAILLEDNPRFDFYSRAFSIAFLVKPTDSDNLHHSGSVLLEKSGSWRLSILPGGRVQIVLYGDDGQGVVLKSEDSLQLNTWNRVVVAIAGFVYEESLVKLYVNQGAPKEGRGPAPVGVAISANPISIGNELHMYIPFKGMIKDLKLFGMSLTEEEIEELFQYRNSLTHSPRL